MYEALSDKYLSSSEAFFNSQPPCNLCERQIRAGTRYVPENVSICQLSQLKLAYVICVSGTSIRCVPAHICSLRPHALLALGLMHQ